MLKSSRHHEKTAACLLEVSFITYPADEARLQDDGYKQEIADAIAGGIEHYLSPTATGLSEEAFPIYTPEAVTLEVIDGDA